MLFFGVKFGYWMRRLLQWSLTFKSSIMRSKSAPEINAGSMADIAFLLLVFFLVTTTMDTDLGLFRKLPQIQEDRVNVIIHTRNVLPILVNGMDGLMVKGEPVDIAELKDLAKEFIANPTNDLELPEKKLVSVPLFGDVMVSKQIVSLQSDNATSYGMYIKVQNEIAKAYNELRDELAQEKFGTSFTRLKETGQKQKVNAIKMVYPQKISEAEPYDANLALR